MNMNIMTREQCYGFDPRLVVAAAKSGGVANFSPSVTEALQDLIADAIAQFDPNKSSSMKTWVFSYIKWQIGRMLKKINKKNSKEQSLETKIKDDGDTVLGDMLASKFNLEETILNNDLRARIEQALTKIDEKGQFIIKFIMQSPTKRCYTELGQALEHASLVKYDFGKRQKTFIKKAKAVHNDEYDYSNCNYEHKNIDVTVTCKKHGEFHVNPVAHLNGAGCPMCCGNGLDTSHKQELPHNASTSQAIDSFAVSQLKLCFCVTVIQAHQQRSRLHARSRAQQLAKKYLAKMRELLQQMEVGM